MKKKYWIWLSVLLLVVVLFLFKFFGEDKTLQVSVENVTRRDIIETVSGSGKIFPETEVKISPEASGELIGLYVKEGDKVQKGEALALIKSISTKSIINFAMPQAGINESKETIKNVTIYAPISGVVSAVYIRKGEKVAGTSQMMGTELLRIADMSKMKVDVNVSENEIQKIKTNDTAIVKVEAYRGKEFKGVVARISQSNAGGGIQQSIAAMTEQMTSYTVSIILLPESYNLLATTENNFMPFRSGMSASAEIQTRTERQVLTVPINAVTTREDDDTLQNETEMSTLKQEDIIKEYVFVVNANNEAIQTEVKTAIQDNRFVQVVSGIQDKQSIIVAPYSAIARTLKNKMKVKVVTKKELYKEKQEDE